MKHLLIIILVLASAYGLLVLFSPPLWVFLVAAFAELLACGGGLVRSRQERAIWAALRREDM